MYYFTKFSYFNPLHLLRSPDEDDGNPTEFGVDGWVTSTYLQEETEKIRQVELLVQKTRGKESDEKNNIPKKPSDCVVRIVRDIQLSSDCLEIDGSDLNTCFAQYPDHTSTLGVPLRYLVLYIKFIDRYVCVSVDIVTEDGQNKTIVASNRQSVVRITPDKISTPLELVPGWNVVVLDLAYIVSEAFCKDPTAGLKKDSKSSSTSGSSESSSSSSSTGSSSSSSSSTASKTRVIDDGEVALRYDHCDRIRVHASTRVSKVFFTNNLRPHCQLPPALQVFSDSDHHKGEG